MDRNNQFEAAKPARLTLKVEECAAILGIGKSSMYELVHEALEHDGQPFAVISIKGKLLISKKSFNSYLEAMKL